MDILDQDADSPVIRTEGRRLRNALSAPFIYGLLGPLVLLDAFVCVYQAVCFRLWGIPQVRRSEHMIIDRHRLPYLDAVQKINCVYCGYANGVLSFTREVAGSTEAYWCPIRHDTAPPRPHRRYSSFAAYGDPAGFARRLRAARMSPILNMPPRATAPSD